MYVSLRFPDAAIQREQPICNRDPGIRDYFPHIETYSAAEQNLVLRYLLHSCPNPEVLSYRAELAEEIFSDPELKTVLVHFCRTLPFPDRKTVQLPGNEAEQVRILVCARLFAVAFDRLCKELAQLHPSSAGAKRFFLYCKNLADSIEYRELTVKAKELHRKLALDSGYSVALGNPFDEEGTARLRKSAEPSGGIWKTVRTAAEEFSLPAPTPTPTVSFDGEYTQTEQALLRGMLRKDPRLEKQMAEFISLFQTFFSDDLYRLRDEAVFFCFLDDGYHLRQSAGYAVCRPQFRKPAFYSELFGLCYKTADGTVAKADYLTSPLNHITVVFGPDSAAYATEVKWAHILASAGGLIFAERGEISPVNRMEEDCNERLQIHRVNEESLCICNHLFDAMLPRQEEAAVNEVLRRLGERQTRSVVRICAKSNLSVLEKKSAGGLLPPCAHLQAGTDRTLEELLQRHKLTEQHLQEDEE